MIISDYYNLVYTAKDLPQHVLKQVQGIKHKALAAYSVDNVKAAEWLLNYIEYQSKGILKRETRMGSISNHTALMLGNYLKHIHAACKDVIQARFDKPVLTDEEAGQLFFNEMLKDCLDKINKGESVSFDSVKTFKGTAKGIGRIDIEREIQKNELKRDIDGLSLQAILTGQW